MLFSKYSTRLSYINVSPFHLGPATTLASLLLARAILQIFEATLYEFLDPWILLFLFKMAEPRRPITNLLLSPRILNYSSSTVQHGAKNLSPCLKFPPHFCQAKWLAHAQPIGPDGTRITQLSSINFASTLYFW